MGSGRAPLLAMYSVSLILYRLSIILSEKYVPYSISFLAGFSVYTRNHY